MSIRNGYTEEFEQWKVLNPPVERELRAAAALQYGVAEEDVTPAQMDFIQRRRFFNDNAFWASTWESVK